MSVCVRESACVFCTHICVLLRDCSGVPTYNFSVHTCTRVCMFVSAHCVYGGACVYFVVYVCACMCVTERRQRESTLLGKLFDIHVEDVINRKQRDPPQCPTATRQGHTKHPQYKHA